MFRKIFLQILPKVFLKIFSVLFLHYLAETKLGVPLLTMIRFDPNLQDILELDFAKRGFKENIFQIISLESFEDYDIEY